MTRHAPRYAEVVGDPVAHSRSPAIHNFWARALGLDVAYRACHVRAEGLADWLGLRRGDPDFAGANLTMPHKQAVVPMLDILSADAAMLGAVNTVTRTADGQLTGYNSDVDGVAEPLLRHGGAPARVQIIGAGGAARAAALGCRRAGHADIGVFNRTPARADGIGGGPGMPLDALGPTHERHILINASAMGMAGHPPVPVDLSRYPAETLVFDMVYAPLETPLLAAARGCGLATIDGLEMLVAQAATAFTLLFGAAAPRAIDVELRRMLTA